MADIRIKDLSSASSSASDDFIAVDGTTNGTRKLSAFSPTFGGNATVTGTLTVNSTSSFAGLIQLNNNVAQYWLDSGATQRRTALVSSGNATYFGPIDAGWGSTGYFSAGTSLILRTNGASGTFNEAVSISTGGNVSIASTSASTTTSSGALVVGNGTSGGLGVGGAIFAGQSVSVVQSLADNNGFRVINTNTAGLPGLYLEGDGSEYALIRRNNSTAGNPRRVEYIATGSGANHYFNTNTIVGATTASTTTSSGALVVSGGVGVAGAINCGGDITAPTTANITGGRFTSVNSNSYIEQSGSDFNYVTASTRPHVFSIGGTTRFQVTTSGIISSLPASAASLTANSTMTFELTSNTSLKIFVRGSDGTTRSTTLTLA